MSLIAELQHFVLSFDARYWGAEGWVGCFLCETPTTPEETPAPQRLHGGSSIASGGMLVLGQLGAGGMGHTLLVVDPVRHDLCVCKIPRAGMRIDRFRSEAIQQSSLSSAEIVKYRGYLKFEHAGNSTEGFLMDFVPGISLGTLLQDRNPGGGSRQRKLPLPFAAQLIQQILNALEVAHKANIAHRDLKPDNVLLDLSSDITAKLCDFGIAIQLSRKERLTVAGISGPGTYAYSAPEQHSGNPSLQSDFFSVGCIFAEMLTGVMAFDNASGATRAHQPRDLDIIETQYGPDLRKLIGHLLEKKSEDRPKSTEEIRTRLDAALKSSKMPRKIFWDRGWPKSHSASSLIAYQEEQRNLFESIRGLGSKFWLDANLLHAASGIPYADLIAFKELGKSLRERSVMLKQNAAWKGSTEIARIVGGIDLYESLVFNARYPDVQQAIIAVATLWKSCNDESQRILRNLIDNHEQIIGSYK